MTQKERIEIVQKQIEHLRKEVDERIGVNNTLWRTVLAGIGGLILLKEDLNLGRFLFLVPPLAMVLISHWLNQMFTIYRAGAAMAEAEQRINSIAGETLLSHELNLLENRKIKVGSRRVAILLVGIAVTLIYWWLERKLFGSQSVMEIALLWELGVLVAIVANMAAIINLWRFVNYFSYIQGTTARVVARPLDQEGSHAT